MTDKTNTNEQEAKAKQAEFEQFQAMQMKIMQGNSQLIGANELNGSYGQKGREIAETLMNSQEVTDIKREITKERQEESKKMGISYRPNRVTDYDLIHTAKTSTMEAQSALTLGNLEKIAKEMNPGIDFNVADKLAGKTVMEAYIALDKAGGDSSKLDGEMKDVITYHKVLTDSYQTSSTISLMHSASLRSYNNIGQKLSEKYAPKKESSEDSN